MPQTNISQVFAEYTQNRQRLAELRRINQDRALAMQDVETARAGRERFGSSLQQTLALPSLGDVGSDPNLPPSLRPVNPPPSIPEALRTEFGKDPNLFLENIGQLPPFAPAPVQEPLEKVIVDGVETFVPRSQAVGQQAGFKPTPKEERVDPLVKVIVDGVEKWIQRSKAAGMQAGRPPVQRTPQGLYPVLGEDGVSRLVKYEDAIGQPAGNQPKGDVDFEAILGREEPDVIEPPPVDDEEATIKAAKAIDVVDEDGNQTTAFDAWEEFYQDDMTLKEFIAQIQQ